MAIEKHGTSGDLAKSNPHAHEKADPAIRSTWLMGIALMVGALLVGLLIGLLEHNSTVNQIGQQQPTAVAVVSQL